MPQEKNHKVDKYHDAGKGEHVFLGVFERTAAQIFLHHLLVKPGHDDRDECPLKSSLRKNRLSLQSVKIILE